MNQSQAKTATCPLNNATTITNVPTRLLQLLQQKLWQWSRHIGCLQNNKSQEFTGADNLDEFQKIAI